jgi:hypothetical protein
MVLAILWVCVSNMHSNVMVWALGAKMKWAGSSLGMGIRHQRYKGVPDDVIKTFYITKELLLYCFSIVSLTNLHTYLGKATNIVGTIVVVTYFYSECI